ncbi:MAG: NAD kinase [Chitinophagaceae bacterium]|nr:NAD kinase [Chitinophagaceae bacterium]
MRIAIYNREFDFEDIFCLKELFFQFQENNVLPVIYKDMIPLLKNASLLPEQFDVFSETEKLNTKKVNYVMSLGGDGTMLDTVCHVADTQIPILGVNLGRLGFLAATGKDQIDFALQSLIKSRYKIDERELIHLDANMPIFKDAPFALNEFSIHRKDSSSLIVIHTYINGEFLCSYWADGIIVSTPTGSTGYSLSCGGPVIFPQANIFVITAVAPHNLNVRPIVVSNENIISFEIEGRSKEFLCTLDARSETIDNSVSIAVRKENFKTKLIRLEGQNFLQTLQSKMYWGMDKRN